MSPEGQRGRRLPSRHRLSTALHVVVGDARGRSGAAPGLARWLARVAPAGARGTVSLAILSDQRVRALNRQYLGRDYATDVLSFPVKEDLSRTQRFKRPPRSNKPPRSDEQQKWQQGLAPGSFSFPSSAASVSSASSSLFLGDIAIARGVARRQARVAGHSERTELRVLALHGLLHLLGYDHEHDRGEMSRVEQRLRRKGGLREGLIERGLRARPSTGSGRAVAGGRPSLGRDITSARTRPERAVAGSARGQPFDSLALSLSSFDGAQDDREPAERSKGELAQDGPVEPRARRR
jgi:probable rRNA maturation factor